MTLFADPALPLSAEAPCGPDPELDPELQNFMAVAEGQLPASYREFKRSAFDARPVLQKLADYGAKCRDLRFAILAAKFKILSDDLLGFSAAIGEAHDILQAQWEHCHPTEAAGGAALRSAFLSSLDDLPTCVLPLQSATLVTDKRIGAITMRMILVATKKIAVPKDDAAPDEASIREALLRHEPIDTLVALRTACATIPTYLNAIRQVFIDKSGYEAAPQFSQLPDLATAIATYIGAICDERQPKQVDVADDDVAAVAEVVTDADAPPVSGAAAATPSEISNVKEASNALQAILIYYATREPSSPARLMLKQANQLVGKSFIEAMMILAPKLAETSKIKFTGDAPFTLGFAQLSALASDDSTEFSAVEARSYTTATRAEATALMRKIELFYKATEPSSPIPLLVERARSFATMDFAALMKEMGKDDKPT